MSLTGKRIVIGITGGIAAYKIPETIRRLKDNGADVQVITTAASEAFVTKLTLQAVSGHAVRSTLFDEHAELGMGHIELAKWADLVVIAPATADVIARLACGMGNDLLTTVCLATPSPIAIVPAMNQQMYRAPAVQRNLSTLREDGVRVWGPAAGVQACGDTGLGRMIEPNEIVQHVCDAFANGIPPSVTHSHRDDNNHECDEGDPTTIPSPSSTPSSTPLQSSTPSPSSTPSTAKPLAGKTIVITAGPTREAIDPVRYLTNHSSGKMGFAIARASVKLGASNVIVIAGPCQIPTPDGVTRIDVTSAIEMNDAALNHASGSDMFIACAAVSDYRPATQLSHKLKKEDQQGDGLTLTLVKNPDILANVAALPSDRRPFVVGFAAETHNVEQYAHNKLKSKRLDAICANDVAQPGQGFNTETNSLQVMFATGDKVHLPLLHKDDLGEELVMRLASHAF